MNCIVQPGHQIRRPDGTLAQAGEPVEVADEVAEANPHALKSQEAVEAADGQAAPNPTE